jgi:hypothetical protein
MQYTYSGEGPRKLKDAVYSGVEYGIHCIPSSHTTKMTPEQIICQYGIQKYTNFAVHEGVRQSKPFLATAAGHLWGRGG